jgi:hypothetical protein
MSMDLVLETNFPAKTTAAAAIISFDAMHFN